jgi:hypothetical protein
MSEEKYGLTTPEGIAFQTMTSGDVNDTCESKPHFNVVREKLRAAARNPDLPEENARPPAKCYGFPTTNADGLGA